MPHILLTAITGKQEINARDGIIKQAVSNFLVLFCQGIQIVIVLSRVSGSKLHLGVSMAVPAAGLCHAQLTLSLYFA